MTDTEGGKAHTREDAEGDGGGEGPWGKQSRARTPARAPPDARSCCV